MAICLMLKIAEDSHALIEPNLHDGALVGISSDNERIDLTVDDAEARRFHIILDGVVEFLATDFKQGNIILDVTIVQGGQTQANDLGTLNQSEYSQDEKYLQKLHRRVVDESLYVLQLNPSYGCQIISIARKVWIEST